MSPICTDSLITSRLSSLAPKRKLLVHRCLALLLPEDATPLDAPIISDFGCPA